MKHDSIDAGSDLGPSSDDSGPYRRVAVIGAGSWGTALAATLARGGTSVRLWGRCDAVVREINAHHTNEKFLPGVGLPPALEAVADIAHAVRGAEAVLIVVPSSALRSVAALLGPHLAPGIPVAICAKGVEAGSGLLMTEVAGEELGQRPLGCISGPTFALETALCHPTAATVAFPFSRMDRVMPRATPATRLALSLSNESFRAYVSDDVVGVEIGGAVKNVIAIACGMMTGAGYAENTRAALITRGLDEMKRLAEALGGRRETVTGLSGIGDLSLTCSSPTSRTMSLGIQLGEGRARADCFDGQPVVVEGELNSITVTDLARHIGIALPICETVRAVLHDGQEIGPAFARLWSAPLEAEPRSMEFFLIDHPLGDKTPAEPA